MSCKALSDFQNKLISYAVVQDLKITFDFKLCATISDTQRDHEII